MSRNIEIKARLVDIDTIAAKAAALADSEAVEILQEDVFFGCPAGRLKLRMFADDTGELIFYRRADEAGPKESFYVRSPTASPKTLREALALAHGEIGCVRKRRSLLLHGRSRIHLDDVEGLGHFLELEVVLGDSEAAATGVREAEHLMNRLGIEPHQLVTHAYIDLLLSSQVTGGVTARGGR